MSGYQPPVYDDVKVQALKDELVHVLAAGLIRVYPWQAPRFWLGIPSACTLIALGATLLADMGGAPLDISWSFGDQYPLSLLYNPFVAAWFVLSGLMLIGERLGYFHGLAVRTIIWHSNMMAWWMVFILEVLRGFTSPPPHPFVIAAMSGVMALSLSLCVWVGPALISIYDLGETMRRLRIERAKRNNSAG